MKAKMKVVALIVCLNTYLCTHNHPSGSSPWPRGLGEVSACHQACTDRSFPRTTVGVSTTTHVRALARSRAQHGTAGICGRLPAR